MIKYFVDCLYLVGSLQRPACIENQSSISDDRVYTNLPCHVITIADVL